jgi:hypothetical protein
MIELGIVLAAYKASFAVTHLFVNWTIDKIGFWLLVPIVFAICVFVVFYAREGYVGYYIRESEGIGLQSIERGNLVPNDGGMMRQTGRSISEPLGNVADNETCVEHGTSMGRPRHMTGTLGIFRLIKSRSSCFYVRSTFRLHLFHQPGQASQNFLLLQRVFHLVP